MGSNEEREKCVYLPTPEEIAAKCAEIRARNESEPGWKRKGTPEPTQTRVPVRKRPL